MPDPNGQEREALITECALAQAGEAPTPEDTERPDGVEHIGKPAPRWNVQPLRKIKADVYPTPPASHEDTERTCPHCGKLILAPRRSYEIDPAAVCKCGAHTGHRSTY